MEYKLIDLAIATQYKDSFLKYYQEVIDVNKLVLNKDEINKIYDNMINYIKDNSAKIVGAFDKHDLVGFIWAYERLVNSQKRYHINYFIVDSDYRKNGIGKHLINEIYEIAKKNGVEKIELVVTYKNQNALHFYEKELFEIERVVLCKDL